MRKLALFLITMIVLTIGVYAEDTANVQKLLDKGYGLKYVANASGKTYVVYTEKNAIGEEYYYIGTIANSRITKIGEIDEMIGGNNEPEDFEVAGITISDDEYYIVTGMTQIDGKVYVSKKRHIYMLDGDKLKEVPLQYNGKVFNMDKYNCTIGKLASNSTDMYIALRAKGHFLTADSEDLFAGPVDCAVFEVSKNGIVKPTFAYVWDHNVYSGWSTWENIISNFSVDDNGKMAYVNGGGLNPIGIYDFNKNIKAETIDTEVGVPDLDGVYNNVLMYKDFMLGYTIRYRMYGNDSIIIKKITLNDYIKSRRSPVVVYATTSKPVAEIEGMYYINHWTAGEDGNIYMVTQDKQRNKAIYVLKR